MVPDARQRGAEARTGGWRRTAPIVIGCVGLAIAAYLFQSGRLALGSSYGYPRSMVDEHRITQVRAETRRQPALDLLEAVRDHLVARDVSCDPYRAFRVEPSPDGGDFSGEVHRWAECGGGALVIHRYSDHSSKLSHLEDRASCTAEDESGRPRPGLAPFKPAYWIEGPNWAVVLERPLSADDAATHAEARAIARRTGARLYRACAPSVQHPAAPVVTTGTGAPLRMVGWFGTGRFTVTVSGATRAPVAGTDVDVLTVTLRVTGVDPRLVDLAVHAAGSESYWMCGGWAADGPVTCHVPRTVADPVLRISTAGWTLRRGPDHLRDVRLG